MSFAHGLTDGIEPGIRLGQAYTKGRSARGVREANGILAEMEALAPVPVVQGGIPADGAAPGGAPVSDGLAYDALKTKYMKALSKVSDSKTAEDMTNRLVEYEKEKILSGINAAITSHDQGDLQGVRGHLAGLSSYTDPGVIPEINVSPDGNIITRDPESGAAHMMTRDQLADIGHRLTNFEGWQDLVFERSKHADDLAVAHKRLASDILLNNARVGDLEHGQGIRDAELGIKQEELGMRGRESESLIRQRDAATDSSIASTARTQQEMEQAGDLHPYKLGQARIEQAAATSELENQKLTREMKQWDWDEAKTKVITDSMAKAGELFDNFAFGVADPLAKTGGEEGKGPDAENMYFMSMLSDEDRALFEGGEENLTLEQRARKAELKENTLEAQMEFSKIQAARQNQFRSYNESRWMPAIKSGLIAGLRAARPDREVMSDEAIAMVVYAVMFDGDLGTSDYDPDTGILRTGNRREQIPSPMKEQLQGYFEAHEMEQNPGAGIAPQGVGIPEDGAAP